MLVVVVTCTASVVLVATVVGRGATVDGGDWIVTVLVATFRVSSPAAIAAAMPLQTTATAAVTAAATRRRRGRR